MKKVILFIICLFVISVVSLTSCQEVNPFDDSMVSAVKYEKDFEHYVGTPAPRHAWGFDIASYMMGIEGVATRTIYKQEMNVPTTDENGNTVWVPAIEFYGKPSDITQEEHDEVFAWFTNHRVNWTNNYANCGNGNKFTGSTKQCDGTAYSRSGESGFTMLDMGSLVTKSANKVGDCPIGTTTFINGWIQYVNSDFTEDEVADNGSKYSCRNMDLLKVVDLNGNYQEHLNEFNGGGGYGWGKQSNQNAILATNSNFNEIEYSCSADGLFHDKYILVHLIGSNYSGWYLGMDFEGGGQNSNQRVKADGVCNDWIVKISDAGQSMFNPARILCEDLGANDFDFNDIVLDVSAATDNNGTLATFTIKAVGGTVPVRLCYGTEDNYVIFSKDGQEELHAIYNDPEMRPINVNASNGKTSSQVVEWKVGFGKEYAEADYNFPNDVLDLQKINFSVFHSNRAEWLTVRNYDENDAVCAPQMICVPVTVEWPEENEPIISHYPKFKDWVANPTNFFWKENTSSGSSNNNGSNTGTATEDNTGSGSESEQVPVIEDPYTLWTGQFQPNSSDVLELDAATLKKFCAESTVKIYFTGDYLCARTEMWGDQLQSNVHVSGNLKYVEIAMTQDIVDAIKSLKGLYFQGGNIYKIAADAIAIVEEDTEDTETSTEQPSDNPSASDTSVTIWSGSIVGNWQEAGSAKDIEDAFNNGCKTMEIFYKGTSSSSVSLVTSWNNSVGNFDVSSASGTSQLMLSADLITKITNQGGIRWNVPGNITIVAIIMK